MLRHITRTCALTLILSYCWQISSIAVTIDAVTAAAFMALAQKLDQAQLACPTNIRAIIAAISTKSDVSDAVLKAGVIEYSNLVQAHHQKMGLASQLAIVEAVKNPSKKPVRGSMVVLDDVMRATLLACNEQLKTYNIATPPSLGAIIHAINNAQSSLAHQVFIEGMRDYAAVIKQHADLMQLPTQKLIVQLVQSASK